MSDELKPGFYVITTPFAQTILWRDEKLWMGHNPVTNLFQPDLPDGWTLGPRIDDLLRDAATLREVFGFVYSADPENEVEVERVCLEWCARYHEYKNDAARYRWLRDNCSYVYPMVAWGEPSPAECGIEWSWQQVKPDEAPDIDALIDADIAREGGE